ncbi:RNA-guided endonuclease TnpB family protein [Streptomyces klenkii]
MPSTEITRAFRFALDPTTAQVAAFDRHAGAARWAFNHALGVKIGAHRRWRAEVDALVADGMPEQAARKAVKLHMPKKPQIQAHLNLIKGDSRHQQLPDGALGPHRLCPWWHEVGTYAFQCAFQDADRAFKNWVDSVTGRRAGRRVGYPRFKRKATARRSFRLFPVRLDGYRRVVLPRIGSVRIHGSAKKLARLVQRGAVRFLGVTVSQSGSRWYASLACVVQQELARTTRAQQARGRVGVDVGVRVLAALSRPVTLTPGGDAFLLLPNPRHADADRRRLTRAQRDFARTQKGSQRRKKAARRIGRIHHTVAERRATGLHTVSKRLTTAYAEVAVEGLHVQGMTASARGTREAPGRRVRQKAGLNRSVLDAAFGELRRQITYKSGWYGATTIVRDRWYPSSQLCSACGWRNPNLTAAEQTFHCTACGLVLHRDLNAARNIEQPPLSYVAPEEEETRPGRPRPQETKRNARGGDVRPAIHSGGRRSPAKREDPAPAGPPRESNLPATRAPHPLTV